MTTGRTATDPMDTDVVICGSGVAGLAAARALGQLGLDVVLLDKKLQQPPIWKGEVLQPSSLGTLHAWEVLQRLEARRAVRLSRLVARTAQGAELLAMDFGILGGGRPWMLAHDYTTILECLGESLGPRVRWQRGILVKDVIKDARGRIAGVRAAQGDQNIAIRARLVVAADGMSSRLRKLIGIDVSPVAYGHKLLSFELSGAPEVDNAVSVHVSDRGLVMVYPLPDDRTRVYIQVRADELRAMDSARLRNWCDDLVARVPALGPLTKALEDNLDRRQLLPVWRYRVPALVQPGIVLVGEAAHVVHPLAAQGMNTSIGDADALAAQLTVVEIADSAAVDGALRAYEKDRMSRIRDIDTMSHNAARMMTGTSRSQRLLGRRLLSGTAKSRRLRYLTTYNMSGLGMRPLSTLDRLVQLGVLPDLRARNFVAPEQSTAGADGRKRAQRWDQGKG